MALCGGTERRLPWRVARGRYEFDGAAGVGQLCLDSMHRIRREGDLEEDADTLRPHWLR